MLDYICIVRRIASTSILCDEHVKHLKVMLGLVRNVQYELWDGSYTTLQYAATLVSRHELSPRCHLARQAWRTRSLPLSVSVNCTFSAEVQESAEWAAAVQ
jgi:hypothetical protein